MYALAVFIFTFFNVFSFGFIFLFFFLLILFDSLTQPMANCVYRTTKEKYTDFDRLGVLCFTNFQINIFSLFMLLYVKPAEQLWVLIFFFEKDFSNCLLSKRLRLYFKRWLFASMYQSLDMKRRRIMVVCYHTCGSLNERSRNNFVELNVFKIKIKSFEDDQLFHAMFSSLS